MRFVAVDDPSITRRIIINTLSRLGCQEIVEAANGREAQDDIVYDAARMITTGRRTLLSFGMAEHEGLVERILTRRVGRRDPH